MGLRAEHQGVAGACDVCGLVTPTMHVTDEEDAKQIMRVAGWRLGDGFVRCPRCHGGPPAKPLALRTRSSGPPEGGG
jgi:hypothetical protein